MIPTALHVATRSAIHEDLLPALRRLHACLARKAQEFDAVVKIGRTHLMDATPVRLGQEFAGYARQVELGIARAEAASASLAELALGGTAVGTGLNCPPGFPARGIARISEASDRKAIVEGELSSGGQVTATCTGTFVAIGEDHPAHEGW